MRIDVTRERLAPLALLWMVAVVWVFITFTACVLIIGALCQLCILGFNLPATLLRAKPK